MASYGQIAWVLTDQLKKECFRWTNEDDKEFVRLKEALTMVPVLALPNFSKPFEIETDAFGYGLEAILM